MKTVVRVIKEPLTAFVVSHSVLFTIARAEMEKPVVTNVVENCWNKYSVLAM